MHIGPKITTAREGIQAGFIGAAILAALAFWIWIFTTDWEYVPPVEEAKPAAPISAEKCNEIAFEDAQNTEDWENGNGSLYFGTYYSKKADLCDKWYDRGPEWQYPTVWTEKG